MNGIQITNDKMQIDHGQPLLIPPTICTHDKIYQNSKESNKLASKKLFVLIQGLISCCFISSFAYYNATITTLEKRYEIPSRNVGLITTGFDLSTLVMTPILSYYLGKMHRPRWVGLSGFVMGIYCLMVAFLHAITGPGDYALSFTEKQNNHISSRNDVSTTMCHADQYDLDECSGKTSGNLFPQFYLFFAQFITGFIGSIHDSLGTAYMDDNILKSKVPLYLGILQCIRLFGPAFGYLLASICLKVYIVPTLSPIIGPNDPQWIGAWWLGYVVIGVGLIIFSLIISCFPNELPRSAFRRQISNDKHNSKSEKDHATTTLLDNSNNDQNLAKIIKVFKSVLSNKIFMFTILSNVFNLFGTVPYTMYGAKYIETQFHQTASHSSLLTGPTTIACTTIGIFASGWLIHKFQPKSQYLAIWILCTACFSLLSLSTFMFIGCGEGVAASRATNNSLYAFNQAISECNCDLVKYTPVCGDDEITYLSPCHAGCSNVIQVDDHTSMYDNCTFLQTDSKTAISGACPVDCSRSLFIFIVILCFERLLTSSGRSSCFFLTVKSIHKQDKEFALAIGMAFTSLLVYVPAPVLFGWIFDITCLFWGKTCNGDGNCWLYDNERTRVLLNTFSIVSIVIGIGVDCLTVWNIKGLLLFDTNEEKLVNEMRIIEKSLNGGGNTKADDK